MNRSELTQQECELLQIVAENDLNITAAAEAAFLHRNTVVYHLKSIENKTGLNPRNFFDLAKLLGEDVETHIPYRERQTVCQSAIVKYGAEHQLNKFNEELGEFLAELGRMRNGEGNPEAFADELADLSIMLEQLRLIFGVNDEVWHHTDYKIDRLRRRIQGESD